MAPFLMFPVMDAADAQLQEYIPVLMLAGLGILTVVAIPVLSLLIGNFANRHRLTHQQMKDTAYECGMKPIGSGTPRLSVSFYLVAMLFILFDIEVVFLYPWAVVFREQLASNAATILGSMATFIAVLFVGYLYALRKGAFEWKK
ncbi:MAG: NADH-quinone oxidoreductase subunit A [Limisphaerales bacterium]